MKNTKVVRIVRDCRNADKDLYIGADSAKSLYDAGRIEQVLVGQTWDYATISEHHTYHHLQKWLEEVE